MNLWDSVHRGLEKASQEAGRIARVQRLRATADGLSRQIQAQHDLLVDKATELFATGRLTQQELFSICQELANLQQQLAYAQQELKLLQTNAAAGPEIPPATQLAPSSTYPLETLAATMPIPPPPPDSSADTPGAIQAIQAIQAAPHELPTTEIRYCSSCHAELLPGYAFCHQCGAKISSLEEAQPTVRGSSTTDGTDGQPTIYQNDSPLASSSSEGGA